MKTLKSEMNPHTLAGLIALIKTVKNLNGVDAPLMNRFAQLFDAKKSFNQPLNNWDVSNIIYMRGTFENAIMYDHSMSDLKLKSNCYTKNFLKKCIMWPGYNDEDDMHLQVKKIWSAK